MTNHRIILIAAALTCACIGHAASPLATITVGNELPQPRTEMVEIGAPAVPQGRFTVRDSNGSEIPYQITYTGNLIFPASVGPNETTVYTLVQGKPSPVDPVVWAQFYPERLDDIAWENDFGAYRAYGPALAASGGKAYGYDAFTKSSTMPVVPERYFRELVQMVSYHINHANGMDVYDVGPTMGAGLAVPLGRDGSLIFPASFDEYRILDNGPLRATIELKLNYGGGTETRVITLDAGTPLNRTTARFEGFDSDSVAAGVVVHKPGETEYILGDCYVAFTDPTTSPGGRGVGKIFTGVVTPADGTTTLFRPVTVPNSAAVGHAMTVTPYRQGDDFTYFWGTCWNKGRIRSAQEWDMTLRDALRRYRSPLKVSVTGGK